MILSHFHNTNKTLVQHSVYSRLSTLNIDTEMCFLDVKILKGSLSSHYKYKTYYYTNGSLYKTKI